VQQRMGAADTLHGLLRETNRSMTPSMPSRWLQVPVLGPVHSPQSDSS
jgi:hypothetical protein